MPGAREIAYLSLERCEKQKKYSNLEIDAQVRKYKLSGAEKGLYVSLIYGVIERMITLDFIVSSLASRPLEKLDRAVLLPLRLGLYQLIFMDRIPQSAAVDESVKIASKYANKPLGGFVNAVLRSFLRATENGRIKKLDEIFSREPFKKNYDSLGKYARLSVKYSYPQWLCRQFAEAYSDDTAESIMEAQNASTSTTFRVNTLKTDREAVLKELAEHNVSAVPTRFSPIGIISDGVAVSELSDLLECGKIFVQDEASQLAALALDAKSGDTVLDCCACPGGKSFSSAMLMQNTGRIVSSDLHESKLSLIKSGAERLGISIIETRTADSSVYDKKFADTLGSGAQRVLCDVPCSGLGVIAKKPEIRYKSKDDIDRLPTVQMKILQNCAKYVAPEGILVYSTCTLNPRENEENIKAFLSENTDFEPVEIEFCSKSGEKIKSESGMITLFPHIHNTDGFFIAKMRRKA
ncbi:MAG: 16S rRNA (cytosine(967)-C(5))-methyltransferase RsmB [Clostridia bacterium]|nr:16S rRNA (cytosine(967)-C(5))-methyltransferase RsmB [Clostridia bacterium]